MMTIEDQGLAYVDASSVPPHPLGIKPLGNQYLHDGDKARAHIGGFQVLPDDMLVQILELLDHGALRRLGYTCRFLYAHSLAEDLWKAAFLESPLGQQTSFSWLGSWRATVLGLPGQRQPKIDCGNVFSDVLHRPHVCSHVPLSRYASTIPSANRISRLEKLSYDEFADKWIDRPFILTDCVRKWPVAWSWSVDRLLELYPDVAFRAEAVDWTFSAYCRYMRNSHDESPVYLFDRQFAESMDLSVGDKEGAAGAAYWRPACFGPDLFEVLGAERPAHRWLIVGPARSGSSFHKDPNATSAWNAVLRGAKYWVMFPPAAAVPGVYASADGAEVTSPLSIAEWLLGFHAAARARRPCVEAVCAAGELLHVPSGWWHLVLNLEPDTVALTQNFVSPPLLPAVLAFMRDRAEQVSGFAEGVADPYGLFVARLRERHPDLLRVSLEEMARKETARRVGAGTGGKKRRWDQLVGGGDAAGDDGQRPPQKKGSGFGFCFGFGNEDDGPEMIA